MLRAALGGVGSQQELFVGLTMVGYGKVEVHQNLGGDLFPSKPC